LAHSVLNKYNTKRFMFHVNTVSPTTWILWIRVFGKWLKAMVRYSKYEMKCTPKCILTSLTKSKTVICQQEEATFQ